MPTVRSCTRPELLDDYKPPKRALTKKQMKEYLEVLLYILTDTLEHTCGIVGSSKFNNI